MKKMETYNYVNDRSSVTPNYSLDGKQTAIDVYFNDNNEVLIVGFVDNNYIHWASLTKASDKELNEQIFNYISEGEIHKVTHLYQALKETGLEYGEVMKWLHIRLTRKERRLCWNTPFGHSYGDGTSQLPYNGRFFATDISVYYKDIQRKCRFREAGGAYEKVLDNYLRVLQDDEGDKCYYTRVKDLVDIIREEDYLMMSPTPEVRAKYLKLQEIISSLYNRYMTAVR